MVDNPIYEKNHIYEEIFPIKYVDSGKGFMATPPADVLPEKCSLVSLQQLHASRYTLIEDVNFDHL
jgi:hypothetical protein